MDFEELLKTPIVSAAAQRAHIRDNGTVWPLDADKARSMAIREFMNRQSTESALQQIAGRMFQERAQDSLRSPYELHHQCLSELYSHYSDGCAVMEHQLASKLARKKVLLCSM